MASFFLGGFLTKWPLKIIYLERYKIVLRCTAKSEDDFKRIFEQFLQDVLAALYRPEWPSAELVLTMLANILIKNILEKSNDISLRVVSLEYLGTISARLRKDKISAASDADSIQEKARLDTVVKTIIYYDQDDISKNIDDVNINNVSCLSYWIRENSSTSVLIIFGWMRPVLFNLAFVEWKGSKVRTGIDRLYNRYKINGNWNGMEQ